MPIQPKICRKFVENLPKVGNYPTGCPSTAGARRGPARALRRPRPRRAHARHARRAAADEPGHTHLTGFSVEVLGVQEPFRGFFLPYQRRFFRLRHYFAFAEIFDDVESLIPEVVESHICRRTSAPFTQMLLNFARTTLDTVQGSFQTTVGIRHSTCDDGTLQFHHHCRIQNINGIIL